MQPDIMSQMMQMITNGSLSEILASFDFSNTKALEDVKSIKLKKAIKDSQVVIVVDLETDNQQAVAKTEELLSNLILQVFKLSGIKVE